MADTHSDEAATEKDDGLQKKAHRIEKEIEESGSSLEKTITDVLTQMAA
jgi:hypothetical protein